MTKNNSNKITIILAFIAIYIIWGSTYLLNKIAVTELPPFFIAGVRFCIAGLLIFLIAKISGQSLKISKKQLLNCTIAGFLFLSFGNGLAVWALQFVDSSFVALEISAQPLVVLLLMRLLQGKKIKLQSAIGVIIGIIGIFILVSQEQLITDNNALFGFVMVLGCMVSWGYGSLFVGKADLPTNYFINTGYQMLSGGIILFIASFLFGEDWSNPIHWSSKVQYSVLALIVFGSIVAFTAFNYLLKLISPEKVATSAYINPIVAMFLGWYFLDENITITSIVAAVVLLTGVYFINSSKKKKIPKSSRKRWV